MQFQYLVLLWLRNFFRLRLKRVRLGFERRGLTDCLHCMAHKEYSAEYKKLSPGMSHHDLNVFYTPWKLRNMLLSDT